MGRWGIVTDCMASLKTIKAFTEAVYTSSVRCCAPYYHGYCLYCSDNKPNDSSTLQQQGHKVHDFQTQYQQRETKEFTLCLSPSYMRSVQRRAQSFWIMFMYASMSLYGEISPHICGCSKKSLLTVTFWIILRWDFHFSIMFKISIVFCFSLRRDLLNRLMMLFRWRNSHILGHFISRTIIFKVLFVIL